MVFTLFVAEFNFELVLFDLFKKGEGRPIMPGWAC
jgi:hypothetical protein